MLKKSVVNAKIVKPVGPKKTENPIKIEKPLKKNDENKEKSKSNTAASSGKTVAVTKKISSSQGTTVVAKPQLNAKPVLTKSKQATTPAPTIRPKISAGTTSKVIRQQPMKAIHQVPAKKPVAEKNVMNTVHNVTVASPPSVRKDIFTSQPSVETLPRERTKTRTLEPKEILILQQSKIDQKPPLPSDHSSSKIEQKPVPIQESIAFEITFEKPTTNPKIDSNNKQTQDNSDEDYDDDFDSYESDFETESSTSSQSAFSNQSSSKSANNSSNASTSSESKQLFSPTKKLDDERDFDSGTYELKGVADKLQLDSIDEREPHSEGQNDSGFGYANSTPSPVELIHSASTTMYSKPPIKPTYSKRGMELMNKINLDTMTFTLFELKPLSYDLYMKVYGHKNTNQSSSQTVGNMIDQDIQTEKKTNQSMWTQFPPNFVTNVIPNESYHQDRIGCGEDIEDENRVRNSDECFLEKSLKMINKTNVVRDVRSTKTIDYERLNFFLQKSELTISTICDTSVAMRDLHKSDLSLSDGFFQISINESKVLNDTEVYYMYSNPRIENLVYFVHRQKLTSGNDNSLVSMWNILDIKKPNHVLSCWSLIICLEVHYHFQDVVIGGLTDGCIAVWNIYESTFWHQHIGSETVLVPTQIVSPIIDTKSIAFDFGCIISLKSIHQSNKVHHDEDFKLTQICSLHEFGMLTIWSILKTNSYINSESYNERKIDHRSPWSKIQLIQNNIIDLGATNLTKKIRPKSGFEKKKMYFESNLFSDATLRELHDLDVQKGLMDHSENFRCVDMEYYDDAVVVATNKSFLILVAISLSRDSLRKLLIDESNFLHATKLKSMEEVLLVGLTDGSVKVLRVRPSNICHKPNGHESFTKPGVTLEENNFSAKSCAIQNIIKEERKFLDDAMPDDRFKQVEKNNANTTAFVCGSRLINNQVLLPAMSLNRDFVRWMDVSVNLNCMIGLCGDYLRLVDFRNFVEIRCGDSNNEISIATMVLGYNNREYMVNVEGDNVRVHLLRKKML